MKRRILIGVGVAIVWAIAVLAVGRQIQLPFALMQPALIGAGFLPGLVLMALIGRMAHRRFADETLIGGESPPIDSAAWVDARVLQNTAEQALLALLIWPLAGFTLGAGTVLALAVSFCLARLVFWIGYHLRPEMRAFGFAATFYPTVLAALEALRTLIF